MNPWFLERAKADLRQTYATYAKNQSAW